MTLGTVVVGDDPASRSYVAFKHRAAAQAGMRAVGVTLAETASHAEVDDAIERLGADPSVHGVFLPVLLHGYLDVDAALARLDPAKDIDGMTATSLGRLALGAPGHVRCTALGIVRLFERHGVATAGSHVVILGRLWPGGCPLGAAAVLGEPRCRRHLGRPGLADREALADLAELCRQADMVVSDVSRPHLVTADWVRPGATVVDAGVSSVDDHIVGDVDFAAVQAVAGAICPNPGGAGPMTVARLLQATLAAARASGAVKR